MIPLLKRLARRTGLLAVRDTLLLTTGWIRFRKSGRTPNSAYQALVSLFCQTGGRSNDLLHRIVAASAPPAPISATGVLGSLSAADLDAIADKLRTRGFVVFPTRLPDAWCDRLEEFALREKAVVRIDGTAHRETYVRGQPRGVRYDFAEATVVRSDVVQQLMADASLLAVAQSYLGCRPVLDLVAMWWNTAWSSEPDKEAAQYFHFDMDRIKWLKFFFYVTDVTPDRGPHTFVAGSHRTGGIPRSILRKGQVRIDDADVLAAYPAADLVELCAPRGTIIAEDTRGLHKGKNVHRGDRLMFQLEYSDSLFGMTYPDVRQEMIASPVLQRMAELYPTVYEHYVARGAGRA